MKKKLNKILVHEETSFLPTIKRFSKFWNSHFSWICSICKKNKLTFSKFKKLKNKGSKKILGNSKGLNRIFNRISKKLFRRLKTRNTRNSCLNITRNIIKFMFSVLLLNYKAIIVRLKLDKNLATENNFTNP